MIRTLSLLFFVIINTSLSGQPEFPVLENNLIYDAPTMLRLRTIADSLNLRFRTCEPSHPYYSVPQGTADYFLFDKRIDAVAKAMQQELSPDELLKQFRPMRAARNVNVAQRIYKYRNEREVTYAAFPHPMDDDILDIDLPYTIENIKSSGWVINKNSTYLWAFYLHHLRIQKIPYPYARLIQYVDCMMDTTSSILLPPTIPAGPATMADSSLKERFIHWANDYPGKPVRLKLALPDDPTEEDFEIQRELYERYNTAYRRWDARRLANLDERMRNSRYWRDTLRKIANEAIIFGQTDDELEYYIERYLSPEVALYLKRKRPVIGTCSMDERPRIHAMHICRLAARTGKWNVFLRSHLNLMNDSFERTSDGSWAFERRGTYLKELDTLNIHTTDLLLGTLLATSSASDNHYYGSIGRIGRALAETSTPDELENQILAMINDPALDLYNRRLLESLHRIFRHYQRD